MLFWSQYMKSHSFMRTKNTNILKLDTIELLIQILYFLGSANGRMRKCPIKFSTGFERKIFQNKLFEQMDINYIVSDEPIDFTCSTACLLWGTITQKYTQKRCEMHIQLKSISSHYAIQIWSILFIKWIQAMFHCSVK